MLLVIDLTLGINKDIIYIYNIKKVEIRLKYLIHPLYEWGCHIGQPKWYDQELIMTVPSPKSCIQNIWSSNPELVISGSHINLQKHCRTLNQVKQIIYPRKMILVLNRHLVQLLIIDTYMHRPIFCHHKQNRRISRYFFKSVGAIL